MAASPPAFENGTSSLRAPGTLPRAAPLLGPAMRNVQQSAWCQALKGEQATAARVIAQDIAARLRDPMRAQAAVTKALNQTAFPRTSRWHPYSVSQGNAGLALMFGYLDACLPGEGWDTTAHDHLELAVRGAEQTPYLPPGLFSGLSGLAFAASQLSRNGTRYRRLLIGLESVLLPQVLQLAHSLMRQSGGIGVGDFDAISGLSGVGAYLLCRRNEPHLAAALCIVVESLVALTVDENGLPRWHTPPDLLSENEMRERYPLGNLNCGLAHGSPGLLAVLALARLEGVKAVGLDSAIGQLAGWLVQNRCDDRWGANWPTAVALTSCGTEWPVTKPAPASEAPFGPSRNAWCYGSPGIARALWLAGEAINHNGFQELALAAMEAVYRRPVLERNIPSPTFCHGQAGLLQITLRFAQATGCSVFGAAAEELTTKLLALYDSESMLGYYDLESGDRHVDQPGLLTGAPGVALVLLAASTNVEPTWDRLFLLS
jgi:hypothetical protein